MLSYEKTPSLSCAIPAFNAMKNVWMDHQVKHPESADIVQDGLDKLDDYHDRMDDVPAYVLAMSVYLFIYHSVLL
jgi:hypothetical protein